MGSTSTIFTVSLFISISLHRIIEFSMLITNKTVMSWLCMLPIDKTASAKQKLCYYLRGLIAFIPTASGLIAHSTFFKKNIHSNPAASLFALMGAIGTGGSVYIAIIAFIMRHEMIIIYDLLSDIYDSGNYNLWQSFWRLTIDGKWKFSEMCEFDEFLDGGKPNLRMDVETFLHHFAVHFIHVLNHLNHLRDYLLVDRRCRQFRSFLSSIVYYVSWQHIWLFEPLIN